MKHKLNRQLRLAVKRWLRWHRHADWVALQRLATG